MSSEIEHLEGQVKELEAEANEWREACNVEVQKRDRLEAEVERLTTVLNVFKNVLTEKEAELKETNKAYMICEAENDRLEAEVEWLVKGLERIGRLPNLPTEVCEILFEILSARKEKP